MISKQELGSRISIRKANRLLLLTGLFRILMIGFVRPRIIELTEERCALRIPLNILTRNHFKSMYMGALTIGAELAAGFMAFYFGRIAGVNAAPIFKSMQSEFFRRPDDNVIFLCRQGAEIIDMLDECSSTGERITRSIQVDAYAEKDQERGPVASFTLELSMKTSSGR